MSHYYVGLLSGTSMDAIDAAVIDFSETKPKIIACHAEPIPESLRAKTRLLCLPGENEINRLGEADIEWGQLFAVATQKLLVHAALSSKDIIAIGSHGQTVRHSPKSTHAFTWQIGDPNTIAALTGITTIADFRRMDIAQGGQGAPLAPAFHRYLFQQQQNDTLVVNIGGIANITYLPADKTKNIIGFDTGPGNTLMDAWCQRHLAKPYDDNSEWAMQGLCDEPLLQRLLKDNYFSRQPPKSTGPEYFNLAWVDSKVSPINIQRTLLELTAKTIALAIFPLATTKFCEILLCGGGARNQALIARIQALLGQRFSVVSTESRGISSDFLEAMLFAWLAKMRLEHQTLDLKSITGAQQPSLLGGIYQSTTVHS